MDTPGDEVLALAGAPPGDGPEARALDTLGAEALEGLILNLREPYRTPCRLCWLEQHSVREAAALCGRPEKTVSAQLTRARRMLQEQILTMERGNGDGAVSGGWLSDRRGSGRPDS